MSQIWIRSILAIVIWMIIARRAYTKRVLNLSGAFSLFLLMAVQIAAGWSYCVMMFVCILISTSNKEARKKIGDSPASGPRNWKHVFSNEITAAVMVLIASNLSKWEEKCLDSRGSSVLLTALMGGIIGHYSCCFRDTWASDLWVQVDARSPRIANLMGKIHEVTRISSGSCVGVAFVFLSLLTNVCSTYAAFKQFLILPLSVLAEHCAIMTHSHLTTKLQFRGYCLVRKKVVWKQGPTVLKIAGLDPLDNDTVVWKQGPTVLKIAGLDLLDNDTVNFLSLPVTSILTGLACSCIF